MHIRLYKNRAFLGAPSKTGSSHQPYTFQGGGTPVRNKKKQFGL